MSSLQIGGLTPLTSTDFPGGLAAVVFFQGCPWRCGYCHNPHLIPRHGETQIAWSDVMSFLQRRKGLLDAVVFSGGEPTLQNELWQAMMEAGELGFKVGLHTGGAYPARVAELLPWLSWVGMDIKAAFSDYDKVTGAPGSGIRACESAEMILASGVAHEFRTTVHPLYHNADALMQLALELQQLGVRHYVLQEFRAQGCADEILNAAHPAQGLLSDELCDRMESMFETFSVRRS